MNKGLRLWGRGRHNPRPHGDTSQQGRRTRRAGWLLLAGSLALLVAAPLAWSLLTARPESVGRRPDFGSAAPETRGAPETAQAAGPAASADQDPSATATPWRLIMPAVGIGADIVPVGIAPDGKMSLPEDVDVIGWYRYGPAPGSPEGSAVLAGHVDDADQGPGVLFPLRQAAPGDWVSIKTNDGLRLRYRVIAREYFPKERLPLRELFARDGAPRLTIITCGGEFHRSVGSYEDNIVVTAVPAG